MMSQKSHNFWSGYWIGLKYLQEFLDIIFSIIVATRIVRSLDIKKSRLNPNFGNFVISHVILDFLLYFVSFHVFIFVFLIEIEFLTYLRFCESPKKVYFIIIILEKINLWIWSLYFQSLSLIKFLCSLSLLLLSLTYTYIILHLNIKKKMLF